MLFAARFPLPLRLRLMQSEKNPPRRKRRHPQCRGRASPLNAEQLRSLIHAVCGKANRAAYHLAHSLKSASQKSLRQIWKTDEKVLTLCREKRGYAPRAYPLFCFVENQQVTSLLYVHIALPGCTCRKNCKYSRRHGAYFRLGEVPFRVPKQSFRTPKIQVKVLNLHKHS